VSGSTFRARPSDARRATLIALLSVAALLGTAASPALAASPPNVSTPFPAVAVAPGAKVSFELTVTSAPATTVRLATEGLPAGWTSKIRGGGYQVVAVSAGTGSAAGKVTLEIDVPADATPGRVPATVRATSSGGTSTLNLEVQVNPTAGGEVTLASDFPSLSGASGTTFTFTLTLTNDTPEDRTFAVSASGPDGWQVQASPSGQTQASSVPVKASSSATITVTANPPASVPAGQYPITVKATEGGQEVDAQLSVEIIGQYQMTLTTPDQRLNAQGTAGSPIDLQLVVQNSGTAPLQGVKLTATPPSGWTVKFSPADTVDSIAPSSSQTITATVTPSSQAIAGDYVATFTATASQTTASQDIRYTIDTSLTWAIVGIGLIVLAFLGLGWVFQRFGRR